MILKFLLSYIIIGLIICYIKVFIHIFKCLKRNIPINIINKYNFCILKENLNILNILFGILVWPIRLYQFSKNENNIINGYLNNIER